jgi:hypothetical protein
MVTVTKMIGLTTVERDIDPNNYFTFFIDTTRGIFSLVELDSTHTLEFTTYTTLKNRGLTYE